MPHLRWAAGLLAAALLPGLAAGRTSRAPDALILKAEAFIDALAGGDFESAARDFDAVMRGVSGPDKLAAFWKDLPSRLGSFRRRTASRRDTLGAYAIVLVTCEFEKTALDVRVVFDKEGRITGFQLVPVRPPAVDRPPDYAPRDRFEEIALTVGEGPWALPATLTRPVGGGSFPALVLVHGSGPNDRDETIGPNKPFRDLAWGLAARGIAVLRYEKRTRAHGPKIAADAKAAFFTVKEETIDDAAAAVGLLRRTPGIDPGRIFVLGHSLGGMLLPRIASAVRDLEPAGFIILAGATRPLPETMIRQIQYLSALDGSVSEAEQKTLNDLKAQAAAIQGLRESDRGSAARWLNAPAAYWLDLKGYDPAAAARAIEQPLLVLQGGRDYQVTVEDFENWKKALVGRPNVSFQIYPACNHLFIEGRGLPTPDEYLSVQGNVARAVVEDIATFILRIGPTGRKRP
ncbi:MAG: alpha/beta fold hydrolase [Candidatus Aminicenantes bacterium]|nr:alpha/beta fold hydrolase [Candidatus Aminicenantes bacterium]